MKHALIVDIQDTDPNSFPYGDRRIYLGGMKRLNIPVHIALTPYQRDQWKHLEGQIGDLVSREGSGLLLEGLLHACSHRDHRIRDPHHQGICTSWFQRSSSSTRQWAEMQEGMEFLEKIFGVKPVGYVPPQHLWNEDTRRAVETSGMKYLITNAMFSKMSPYRDSNIIIVPSGSVKHGRTNTPVAHVYYDRIMDKEDIVEDIATRAVPLSEIPLGVKSLKHRLNRPYLWTLKQMRDGKRLMRWIVNAEARKKPSAKSIREERESAYLRHKGKVFGN